MDTSDFALAAYGERGEGWMDAYQLLQAFRRKAIAAGTTYIAASAVAIETDYDKNENFVSARSVKSVTLSTGDTITLAPEGSLVVCAGTASPAVARLAGVSDIPVRIITWRLLLYSLSPCPPFVLRWSHANASSSIF